MTVSDPNNEREVQPQQRESSLFGYISAAGRLVLGYVLAVAAGAVVFAALLQLTSPYSSGSMVSSILELALICFALGLIYALPYTLIASLLLRFVLPKSVPVFFVLGTLCPAAAIVSAQMGLGGVVWPAGETAKMLLLTVPAGLLATYLFGAIGFGFGFGRWRFG